MLLLCRSVKQIKSHCARGVIQVVSHGSYHIHIIRVDGKKGYLHKIMMNDKKMKYVVMGRVL